MTDSSPFSTNYIMDGPNEGLRMELKTDANMAEQQLRWAGLGSEMRALDVGCATGAVTRVMSRLADPGYVAGVDISASRLAQARQYAAQQNLEIDFIQSDAYKLDLQSGAFDFTWSRFLFEYLHDPNLALNEVIRVTRPGGIVVIADLDNQLQQLYPFDETLQAELSEAIVLFRQTGFDPYVGRKLYHWFYQAGLQNIEVNVTPHQIYAGKISETDLSAWREKLNTVAQRLTELTGERARWEKFSNAYLERLQGVDTLYFSTLILVKGIVPSKE